MPAEPRRRSALNPHPGHVAFTRSELDAIAWRFLGSQFAELIYADWPIDRRLEAYLAHHDMAHVSNDGDAYNAVLQHVLTNIGPALRAGVLANTTWLSMRRRRDETHSPARAPMPSPQP